MGVRRAVELTVEEAQRSKAGGFPVYTLGSLIHNPKVLADLKALGVKSLDEFSDCCCKQNCDSGSSAASSVIIRAHGISPAVEKDLRDKGCHIIDATCLHVKASQIRMLEFSHKGYSLFLAGEAKHAEITGLLGYGESAPYCVVVGSAEEARKAAGALYKKNPNGRTALLGQTTISEEEYRIIGEAVNIFFPNLEIIQTICSATTDRQQALRELISDVDAVIIVGGKKSAHTSRLLAIAQKSGKPCILVESAAEIPLSFFNYETVGISAGASTPESLVDEVEAALKA